MTPPQLTSTAEDELVAEARRGDEAAYSRLVDAYQRELQAHCYRMLGSVHDAEDAVQDALLRAWKALPRFEGRSSLRSWLYRIATNTCLDVIGRRPKRVLPVDYGPATDPHDGPGDPLVETVWVEPYPDDRLPDDFQAGPEARYEQHEAVELAFIAALQLLPATQRAVLVLREVLGFSAKETAEALETSVASVNSALQRARATIESRLPERTQQQTLRSLGDDEVAGIVERYMRAWEQNDIETVVGLLAEDATFSMPPLASWFGPRDEIAEFLAYSPMSGAWRWKPIRVRANGQEALAFYAWDDELGCYMPFALNVLTFRDERISDVTAFIAKSGEGASRAEILRMPERAYDERALAAAFGNFGLPARLEK